MCLKTIIKEYEANEITGYGYVIMCKSKSKSKSKDKKYTSLFEHWHLNSEHYTLNKEYESDGERVYSNNTKTYNAGFHIFANKKQAVKTLTWCKKHLYWINDEFYLLKVKYKTIYYKGIDESFKDANCLVVKYRTLLEELKSVTAIQP